MTAEYKIGSEWQPTKELHFKDDYGNNSDPIPLDKTLKLVEVGEKNGRPNLIFEVTKKIEVTAPYDDADIIPSIKPISSGGNKRTRRKQISRRNKKKYLRNTKRRRAAKK